MKKNKRILMRSWGNYFGAFVCLGISSLICFIFFSQGKAILWSGGFYFCLILFFITFPLGILMLTSKTWSYIDYNKKAIIQKGKYLIFFTDSEENIFCPLQDIDRIEISMERLSNSISYTPLLYNIEGKKYELYSTGILRTAKRVVMDIHKAVTEERKHEPIIKIPTKEDIRMIM